MKRKSVFLAVVLVVAVAVVCGLSWDSIAYRRVLASDNTYLLEKRWDWVGGPVYKVPPQVYMWCLPVNSSHGSCMAQEVWRMGEDESGWTVTTAGNNRRRRFL